MEAITSGSDISDYIYCHSAPPIRRSCKVLACTVQESPHPCPTHLPPQFYHLLLLSFRQSGRVIIYFYFLIAAFPHLPLLLFFFGHLAACGILDSPTRGWNQVFGSENTESLITESWGSPFLFLGFFFLEAVHFLNYSERDVSFSILILLWKNLSFLSCCHSSVVFLYVLDDSVWGGKVAFFWL